MKKLVGFKGILLFLAFLIALGTSCEDDDQIEEVADKTDSSQVQEDDPQEEDDAQSEVAPNQVMASLVFDNMKVINGTPSASKSTAKGSIDLKIDSDTIFWTPGIIKRIKIKKPAGISLKHGAWVYVPGADSYIETTLREDEESEEVAILYFDFNPTGWELPITFPIQISPLDENGKPADTFEEPTCIEKPRQAGGACTTRADIENYFWLWQFYKRDNPQFFTGPWIPHIETGTTDGCCIDGKSEPDAICDAGTLEYRQLDYEIVFMRPQLFMLFTPDSRVSVFGQLYTRNLDPFTSNFCSNKAGYSENNLKVEKNGDFSINTDCSISLDNFDYGASPSFLVDPTLYIGGGSQIKYTIISDHYMQQTISGGGSDGGRSGEVVASVFERRSDIDHNGNITIWYD